MNKIIIKLCHDKYFISLESLKIRIKPHKQQFILVTYLIEFFYAHYILFIPICKL
ncbi:hypothetical protein Lalb_Chr14g0366631 [Lupinus albus]|uniref:Uncharacterized protein n=1 Tax=Lupinus albus TaxID=3870 RepID=A0A6A4PBK2_LUPAL|nr:hypothetical protein Lalb_Chr14g0366631 [Lupinus albus]